MSKELTEAQKLDILLGFSKEFSLKETEDPASYTMNCGGGYTLNLSIKTAWTFTFNDGVETTEYNIDSAKVPFTNAKDARKLHAKYENECKRVLAEKRGEPEVVDETQEAWAEEAVRQEEAKEKKRIIDHEQEEKNRLAREENERRLAEKEAMEGQEESPVQREVKKPAWNQTPKRMQEKKVTEKALVKAGYNVPDPHVFSELAKKYNYSEKQLHAIKNTVAKGATDDEFEMFMYLADRYQLDPVLKEIFFSSNLQTIMTSRDGYLKIAHRDSAFRGIQSMAVCENDTFEMDVINCKVIHKFGKGERGKVIGAWAIVKKEGLDPVVAYAPYEEHVQPGSKAWKYKSAMLCKCAESFALKRQFCITGLVTHEEFGIENVEIIDADYKEVEAQEVEA